MVLRMLVHLGATSPPLIVLAIIEIPVGQVDTVLTISLR
jgi:hypothetical protein